VGWCIVYVVVAAVASENLEKKPKGPRDVVDVPWALILFSSSVGATWWVS
jgi:hypothetical protein